MRCPWELMDKAGDKWHRCREDWPHPGQAHPIGSFILHTPTLEMLRGQNIARRLW